MEEWYCNFFNLVRSHPSQFLYCLTKEEIDKSKSKDWCYCPFNPTRPKVKRKTDITVPSIQLVQKYKKVWCYCPFNPNRPKVKRKTDVSAPSIQLALFQSSFASTTAASQPKGSQFCYSVAFSGDPFSAVCPSMLPFSTAWPTLWPKLLVKRPWV